MSRKMVRKNVVCFIFAMMAVISFTANTVIPTTETALIWTEGSESFVAVILARLRLALGDCGIGGGIFLVGCFLFFRKFVTEYYGFKHRFSVGIAVTSFLFAVIMVLGRSIQYFDDLSFITGSKFQIGYSMLILVGYWIFFYAGIQMLFEKAGSVFSYVPQSGIIVKVENFILEQRPFVGPMLFLLLMWLPYWIAYFPGSVMFDAFVGFNCYFGLLGGWSDHHPVFSSIVLGGLLHLGRTILNDNLGIFFCGLVQHILLSTSIAYSISSMKKWGIAPFYRMLMLLFYGCCPIVAFWPHSIMKDCLFFAFIIFNSTCVLNLMQKAKSDSNAFLLTSFIALTGILASLTRHNGKYVVVMSVLALCLTKVKLKYKYHAVACALVIWVGTSIISNGLINLLDASPASVGEALSIPFQQTARYVKEYGDEVTDEEKAIIDKVLVYESLADNYDSNFSDPVKDTYRHNEEALKEYFQVWLKMFFKHPIVYIEATLCNTYSYYYPDGESTVKRIVYNYIDTNPDVNIGYFDIKYQFPTRGMRMALDNLLYVFKAIPGIGLLCHMGTYTWISILLISYAVYSRHKGTLFGYVPAFLNFLVCLASPVNGYFRYFMPNILLMPIMIGWTMKEFGFNKKGDS